MSEREEFKSVNRTNAISLMFSQLGLNKTDKVQSAEEIGWWDPDVDVKMACAKTMQWIKQINFYNFVYPNNQMKDDVPKCIFVPSKPFLRKMIVTVAKHSSLEEVKIKFAAF